MKSPTIAPERVMNEGAARVLQWLDQHPEHDLRRPITGRLVAQIAADLAMLESSVWRRLEELRNLPRPKIRAAVPTALLPTPNGQHPTPNTHTPAPHEEKTPEMSTHTLEKPSRLSGRQEQVWDEMVSRGLHPLGHMGWAVAKEIGAAWETRPDVAYDAHKALLKKCGRQRPLPEGTPLDAILVTRETTLSEEPAPSSLMGCGHPQSAVVGNDEGTNYCGACAAESLERLGFTAPAEQAPSSTPEPLVDPFEQAAIEALRRELDDAHRLLDAANLARDHSSEPRTLTLPERVQRVMAATEDLSAELAVRVRNSAAQAAEIDRLCTAHLDACAHNAALVAEVEQLRSQVASLQAAQTSSTPVRVRHEEACADIPVTHAQPLSEEERHAAAVVVTELEQWSVARRTLILRKAWQLSVVLGQ